MRARTPMVLGRIAVPAQNLERRVVREPLFFQFAVEVLPCSSHSFPMRFASALDMIQCKEPKIGFSAASASPAVGINRLCSEMGGCLPLRIRVLLATGFAIHVFVFDRKHHITSTAAVFGFLSSIMFDVLAAHVFQALRTLYCFRIGWQRHAAARAKSGFLSLSTTFSLRLFGCHA